MPCRLGIGNNPTKDRTSSSTRFPSTDIPDTGFGRSKTTNCFPYVMEACAAYGKQFVVLDRPNPVSGISVEGNLVEEDVRSFVGLLPRSEERRVGEEWEGGGGGCQER